MTARIPTAAQWATCLESPEPALREVLAEIYGPDPHILRERLRLLRSIVGVFLRRFGDRPVRIFRCPGRINLRGMHVDTHGGYLNLMTHQREIVAAVSPHEEASVRLANIVPAFEEVVFDFGSWAEHPAFRGEWISFINHPDVCGPVLARRGDWGNYVSGAVLSAQHRFPQDALRGIHGVIGSDLPRGAALSSSTALSVIVLMALLGCNDKTLDREGIILAVRDAEWYTGARGGISDQAAMILGGQNLLVNVALLADQLNTATARMLEFPEALRVLVVNSYTERSLSGAEFVAYTRNRFAYSLAMEILRQEMRRQGIPEALAQRADRLAHLSPDALETIGGSRGIFRLLLGIPEEMAVSDLRQRYQLPNVDAAYQQYFGTVPEEARPERIALRGPLLFGIAESERARIFPDVLRAGDYKAAGRLMTIGHDGDRRVRGDGAPYVYDVGDEALRRFAAERTPIHYCPGAYGASSPVLDALVDAALDAGALGASLTGGGIAGTVLALCEAGDAGRVGHALRHRLAAADYCRLSGRPQPLTDEQLAEAVVINHAPAAAGEITVPAR